MFKCGLSLSPALISVACLLLLSCPSFGNGASLRPPPKHSKSKNGNKKHGSAGRNRSPPVLLGGSSWGPAPDSACCNNKVHGESDCCDSATGSSCVYTSGGWIQKPECTCNQASDCAPPYSSTAAPVVCQTLMAPLPASYQGTLCTYPSTDGGCFATGTKVTMADMTSRPIEDLRKGDRVLIPATPTSAASDAQIICVVTKAGTRTVQLPGASGLRITPWHPVRDSDGSWVFPANLIAAANGDDSVVGSKEALSETLPLVYNLVLDSGHVVVADGVEAVTLAHGFEDNDVVRHAYYGTDAVLKDLRSREGWESGLVHLD